MGSESVDLISALHRAWAQRTTRVLLHHRGLRTRAGVSFVVTPKAHGPPGRDRQEPCQRDRGPDEVRRRCRRVLMETGRSALNPTSPEREARLSKDAIRLPNVRQ